MISRYINRNPIINHKITSRHEIKEDRMATRRDRPNGRKHRIENTKIHQKEASRKAKERDQTSPEQIKNNSECSQLFIYCNKPPIS
jgi:hypothetical protein